jgi:hypothetical protein
MTAQFRQTIGAATSLVRFGGERMTAFHPKRTFANAPRSICSVPFLPSRGGIGGRATFPRARTNPKLRLWPSKQNGECSGAVAHAYLAINEVPDCVSLKSCRIGRGVHVGIVMDTQAGVDFRPSWQIPRGDSRHFTLAMDGPLF